jgi:hypothetical protein
MIGSSVTFILTELLILVKMILVDVDLEGLECSVGCRYDGLSLSGLHLVPFISLRPPLQGTQYLASILDPMHQASH